jgi:hypothetical protein
MNAFVNLDEQLFSNLWNTKSFVEASDTDRAIICNGCGSAKAKFDFVPDSIYGLLISDACDQHDWDYHFGLTEFDRFLADVRFLVNMVIIINSRSVAVLKAMRFYRATTYFIAVRLKGGKAFWYGKEKQAQEK